MQRSASLSTVTCVLAAALAAGCLERPGATVGPEIGFGQEVTIGGSGVNMVDLLFVIDDSGSMREEQINLAREIGALVRDLASPPDRDGNGAPDWSAVESLRIGVANTDTGTGTVQIAGSNCVPGGDDGRLQGAGLFEWTAEDDPDAFAAQVADVVQNLGLRGCAFEQQLEAASRALFHTRAFPGDAVFPRDEALLAIIVVTDEEDCSVQNDDAFFAGIPRDLYNVHCTRNASGLTAVSELLAQIRGSREDDEIVFAAITGVPMNLPPDITPAEILALPEMQYAEVIDPDTGGLVPRPVCEFRDNSGTSLGEAAPARRLVELANMLPGSVLHTICTDDFGPAIAEIAARIGSRVPGVCLARALPEGTGSAVPCEVKVTLPVGDACDSLPGYSMLGMENGRQVCAVTPVTRDSGQSGYFYDPSRDGCPQLVLTDDAVPPLGSRLDAECFFNVLFELGEQCARASQCASGYCDPITQVCAPFPEGPDSPGPTG